VRVVLWTNEENGGRGGLAYRDRHLGELAGHVMMMESDGGVFRPLGFKFQGSAAGLAHMKAIVGTEPGTTLLLIVRLLSLLPLGAALMISG